MSKARYLVTGGGGFIGSHIAEGLLARGEKVRVIDDFSTGRRQNLRGLDVELVEGSITDPEALARAVAGVEVIFHEAALPSVPRSIQKPLESDRVNVHGTLMLLEAARSAGVRRLMFAGSSSAYGDTQVSPKHEGLPNNPLSPYAVTKVAGEHYLRVYAQLHGLETLTIRYFNVFGPRQDPAGAYAAVIPLWIEAALTGKPLTINGDGLQTRDFGYIENVVHANLLAATTSTKLQGEIVNVSCGESISLVQLADAIAEEVGGDVKRIHGPARAGDVRDSLADISRAHALLGYEPQVRWREGLARTVAALRRELAERGGGAP
jgi:UDP-glucose 4-epimerase